MKRSLLTPLFVFALASGCGDAVESSDELGGVADAALQDASQVPDSQNASVDAEAAPDAGFLPPQDGGGFPPHDGGGFPPHDGGFPPMGDGGMPPGPHDGGPPTP